MSDVPETPDGAVEAAAQDAGQAAQDRPVMPDGWTGEFDPHRAKATIDRLREFEGQLNKLKNDPEAFQAFAQENGYEFVDDTPDEPEPEWEPQEYEDPNAARIDQLQSRLDALTQQEEMQQIAAHVAELTQDTDGVDLETQKYLFEVASQPGYNPERTTKIVKQHLAAIKAAEERAIENYRNTKRSPQPPPLGGPGQEAPDLNDPKARREWMAARIAAEDQG